MIRFNMKKIPFFLILIKVKLGKEGQFPTLAWTNFFFNTSASGDYIFDRMCKVSILSETLTYLICLSLLHFTFRRMQFPKKFDECSWWCSKEKPKMSYFPSSSLGRPFSSLWVLLSLLLCLSFFFFYPFSYSYFFSSPVSFFHVTWAGKTTLKSEM